MPGVNGAPFRRGEAARGHNVGSVPRPRAKVWGGAGAPAWGPLRPPFHRLLRRPRALQPPSGALGQPSLPNNLSCPRPGHRPTSSAVSAKPRWCPPRGAATQPLLPGRPGAPPRPEAPASRASPSRRVLRAWGSARPARPPQPDCADPERRGDRAGGASPEPRPGPDGTWRDAGAGRARGREHAEPRDGARARLGQAEPRRSRPSPSSAAFRRTLGGTAAGRRWWGSVRDTERTWVARVRGVGLGRCAGPAQRSSRLCPWATRPLPLATPRSLPLFNRSRTRSSSKSLRPVSRLFKQHSGSGARSGLGRGGRAVSSPPGLC